jgi:hypothetical protein
VAGIGHALLGFFPWSREERGKRCSDFVVFCSSFWLARFLLRRRNENQQRCCCGYAAGAPRCVSTMYSTLLK